MNKFLFIVILVVVFSFSSCSLFKNSKGSSCPAYVETIKDIELKENLDNNA